MDPLSITASIVAVLQATNAVISVCYDYSAALKGAPWELSKVADELKGLRDVLESLATLANTATNADSTAQSRLPTLEQFCDSKTDSGPLASCLSEIDRIHTKLIPPSWSGKDGSKRQALIKALGWPLKAKDTQKALENISKFKSILTLALTSDQASVLLAVQDSVEKASNVTLDIQKRFASEKFDDNREKLYSWLSAPDPSVNLNDAYKKRKAGTGSWLLESKQYLDWKTTSDSFLWLHGIPGCGKTVLSSTIIEDVLHHCLQHSHSALAYYFFDFSASEKQLSNRMVRSLLTQISRQQAAIPSVLTSLYTSCKDGQQQPTTHAILAALQQLHRESGDVFVVLDALDECTDRSELLDVIEEIHGWKLGTLHFLVTSRKEKDIQESLEPLIGSYEQMNIQSVLVDDDIRAYIQERLRTDRQLKRWQTRPEVQGEIEKELMDKADGMFRWAACQLDALSSCLTVPMLRKALKSLPPTLDETYVRILCSIPDEYHSYAFKVFQWLAFSLHPLSLQQVLEILAVDEETNTGFDPENRLQDQRDIFTICSSLVTTVTKTQPGKQDVEELRLAHYSVKEYLVSDRVTHGAASRYSIAIEPHKLIAQTCLHYLLYFSESCFIEVDDLLVEDDVFKTFPLLGYAARQWQYHARDAECYTDDISRLSLRLFQSESHVFTNWLVASGIPRASADMAGTPLYHASLQGLLKTAKAIIEAGADVNVTGGDFGTALQAASYAGYYEVVQLLINSGAEINTVGGEFGTALYAASYLSFDEDDIALHASTRNGKYEIVKLLIAAGADVNTVGGEYGTALQAAARTQNYETVKLLIDVGTDINMVGKDYGTALQGAATVQNREIVKLLIDAGADVNAVEDVYGTALQVAAKSGNHETVRLLIDSGADVNAVGGPHGTALRAASYRGHDTVIQLLLDTGADKDNIRHVDGTALQTACKYRYDATVRLLIHAGADVNAAQGKHTALISAITGGERHIAEQLLKAGARFDPMGEGPSALLVAAMEGDCQIVEWLLEAGAQVNVEWLQIHALMEAIGIENRKVARRLLEAGEDLTSEAPLRDRTALEAAALVGDRWMIPLLLKAEAEVNHHSEWYCQSNGYQECVHRLLEAGAEGSDPTKNDSDAVYSDALHIATNAGAYEVVLLLLEAGAKVDKRLYHENPLYLNRPSSTPEQVVERLKASAPQKKGPVRFCEGVEFVNTSEDEEGGFADTSESEGHDEEAGT